MYKWTAGPSAPNMCSDPGISCTNLSYHYCQLPNGLSFSAGGSAAQVQTTDWQPGTYMATTPQGTAPVTSAVGSAFTTSAEACLLTCQANVPSCVGFVFTPSASPPAGLCYLLNTLSQPPGVVDSSATGTPYLRCNQTAAWTASATATAQTKSYFSYTNQGTTSSSSSYTVISTSTVKAA